jgi:hypothetical protein
MENSGNNVYIYPKKEGEQFRIIDFVLGLIIPALVYIPVLIFGHTIFIFTTYDPIFSFRLGTIFASLFVSLLSDPWVEYYALFSVLISFILAIILFNKRPGMSFGIITLTAIIFFATLLP